MSFFSNILRPKVLLIILGVVLLSLFGLHKAGVIGSDEGVVVELGMVRLGDLTEVVSASGMIQPVVEVNISPEVSGEIIKLNIQEGDSVKSGALLARIRPDNFISAVDRARAAYNQQQANLAVAKSNLAKGKANFVRAEQEYKRQQQLKKDEVVSVADFQRAEAEFLAAKEDLAAAEENVKASNYIVKSSRASLAEAQENLRLTNIVAPMDGKVTKLSVEKGERVVGTQTMAGTEMMRIADLSAMEARVDVNENDIIRVHKGDTAIINVDSYAYLNKKFTGVVTSIANTAKDKASADAITEFEVKIRVLNSSYADLLEEQNGFPFRPGMTASVEIKTKTRKDAVMAPLSAVTTRSVADSLKHGGVGRSDKEIEEVVFIKDGDVAKKVPVKTGISNFDFIEITEGLNSGDELITGPYQIISRNLNDGDKVRVAEKEEE
ncbi:efflux RND transporter periplasmic adaptor subunit [Persicobacter psychrovividus]|uniref:RND transporter n=1 Tax=Persicobacter psychrovividus TaxID=387638 RepID=A0ABM7VEI2_9BACT|nr:RND transporter [Persicobacter psychrovividus]